MEHFGFETKAFILICCEHRLAHLQTPLNDLNVVQELLHAHVLNSKWVSQIVVKRDLTETSWTKCVKYTSTLIDQTHHLYYIIIFTHSQQEEHTKGLLTSGNVTVCKNECNSCREISLKWLLGHIVGNAASEAQCGFHTPRGVQWDLILAGILKSCVEQQKPLLFF